MKWQRMEFRQRRSDPPEDFVAKDTIQSEINRSSKPPEPTSSQSFTQTETALLTGSELIEFPFH
jgi:hypothetical protein